MQDQDTFCKQVKTFLKTGQAPVDPIKAKYISSMAKEFFLENDILWRRLQRHNLPPRTVLVVPQNLRWELIQEAHGSLLTGHGGMHQTKERLLESYFWPNMEQDISLHLKSCEKCQKHRTDDRPLPNLLSPLPQCTGPNQRVHIDLFGL